MKQWMKLSVIILAAVAGVLFVGAPATAAPRDVLEQGGCDSNSTLCADSGDGVFSLIRSIIQVMFIIAGIIAVIMIIIGGITYTTSVGDPAKTKKAKDTVLYSVVGLVVSLMAYAIVTYVVNQL